MSRTSRLQRVVLGRAVHTTASAGEQARALVAGFLDERDAVEGARVAHGAIRDKYLAAAARQREERVRRWRTAADQDAVVQSLVELSASLLDELSAGDSGHRSAQSWLERSAPTRRSSSDDGR